VRTLAIIAGVGMVLGLCLDLSAFVLSVPSEYPTIQAGVDAAVDGDTVVVADGMYTGDGNRDIDFWGKAIVVMSENGPEATIIDCEGHSSDPHRAFYLTRGEGPESVIKGFTITNGWFPGGGGGIRCALASSPTIVGNVIVRNVAYYGGGIACTASDPIIASNTIGGNQADEGGGIVCFYHSYPTVFNSIVWNNQAGTGSSIHVDLSSEPIVTYSNVEGGWTGLGNLDEDPMFVRVGRRDVRLLWPSPSIDAGHPDSLDPDSTRGDMGALFFDQSKELVVYVTPESKSVAAGDRWRVLYSVVNCHDEPKSCWGIVELWTPEGEPWPHNPLQGPAYTTFAANSSWQTLQRYNVPWQTPLGTWRLSASVGFPEEVWDEDTIWFTVHEPASSSGEEQIVW